MAIDLEEIPSPPEGEPALLELIAAADKNREELLASVQAHYLWPSDVNEDKVALKATVMVQSMGAIMRVTLTDPYVDDDHKRADMLASLLLDDDQKRIGALRRMTGTGDQKFTYNVDPSKFAATLREDLEEDNDPASISAEILDKYGHWLIYDISMAASLAKGSRWGQLYRTAQKLGKVSVEVLEIGAGATLGIMASKWLFFKNRK
jgi:hypothetical protein